MRAVYRFAILAVAAQLATACSAVAEFNPFDGDPNGPPPAPQMWSGPNDGRYAGEPEIVDTRRSRGAEIETASNDYSYTPSKPTPAPRKKITASSGSRSDYDRSFGTNQIDSAPLPPPTDYAAEPSKPRYTAAPSREVADATPTKTKYTADPAPDPAEDAALDAPATAPTGERTLRTTSNPNAPVPASEKKIERTLVHTVKPGEDLATIADQYHVREVDIIQANAMRPPYKLARNQQLRIPVIGVAGPVATPGEAVVAGNLVVPVPKPDPLNGKKAPADPAAPADKTTKTAKADDGSRFIWPVSGKVIAAYGAHGGGLYNEGINIAVPTGTPVHAAAGGTVRYAGNELRGYGNLVLIEHDGGYVTAYAHNDSLNVKRGDRVERGQVIAKSGATGNVKSPQLHFEIRKGTQSVDPSKYLTS